MYYIDLYTEESHSHVCNVNNKKLNEAISVFEKQIKNVLLPEDEYNPVLQLTTENSKTVALHIYDEETTLYSKEAIISLLMGINK